jgi:hypothetical protein
MVALPAWAWRFGRIVAALIAGFALGVFVGLLAWIGSDSAVPALAALMVVTVVHAAFMALWMSKYWPGARALSGPERVAVVRAARSGHDIGDASLAPGVIEYSRALHAAARRSRLWRWLIVALGVVALGTAIADTIYSPVREAVLSWLYFAFFPIEAWWWPRRQATLLINADRAQASAVELLARHSGRGGRT